MILIARTGSAKTDLWYVPTRIERIDPDDARLKSIPIYTPTL